MAGMLIAGEVTDGAAGEGIDVVDPATEETLESVPRGTAADVDAAVNAADAAFGAWSKTDAEDRAILLRKAIALIERDRKELTTSLVHEQGKPVTEAGGEIHHLIHGLNYYADLATKVRGSHHALPSALRSPSATASNARLARCFLLQRSASHHKPSGAPYVS